MKSKYILLLLICAIVTLSFSIASNSHTKDKAMSSSVIPDSSPAGGLASEDPIK